MSVTILPYIDQQILNQNQKQTSGVTNTQNSSNSSDAPSSNSTNVSFQETLELSKKALNALSADSYIAKAKSAGQNGVAITAQIASAIGLSTYTAASLSGSTSANQTNQTTKINSISSGSDNLETYFSEAAKTYNVDVNLLKAIAKTESAFDPSATSSSGAMGIMQLMPATAASLGVSNAYDPQQNIMGGAKLISQLLGEYNGDISLALAAYNAGSGSVKKYGGIPPFPETQNYVKKVLNYYQG